MTIKEIRNEFAKKVEFSKLANTGLEGYYESEWRSFEELYTNGTVTNFSSDFLAFANGYQTTTGEYDNLSILQTFDLHRVTATKKIARAMMMRWLNID